MAREEQTKKSKNELEARVWELAEKIGICTFVTMDGKKQAARPLDGTVKKDENAVYFLTDAKGKKIAQLKKSAASTLVFADSKSMKFVNLTGTAKVTNDRAKIKEIWTATSKAWWESEDDPAIRLVTFTPGEAELWDSPNLLVSTALMLTAAVTGAKPKIGDHAKIAVKSATARPATKAIRRAS